MNAPFSKQLTQLRTQAGLTNDKLANLAKVPRSLIPGLQSGKRRVGEKQARKIGMALKLEGPELEQFVFAAINNCSEKVLSESKDYPAEVLNLLAGELRKEGIPADSISGCEVVADGNILLTLSNGRRAVIKSTLTLN